VVRSVLPWWSNEIYLSRKYGGRYAEELDMGMSDLHFDYVNDWSFEDGHMFGFMWYANMDDPDDIGVTFYEDANTKGMNVRQFKQHVNSEQHRCPKNWTWAH
jgi:hypothetical protein